MENVKYTIDERRTEKEMKKVFKRARFKNRVQKVSKWVADNKVIVLTCGPALIGLATVIIRSGAGIIKAGVNTMNVRNEKKVKDFYCYDRSLGHYWSLRRELSNREWVEIDNRKKNGERLADILKDLHVLK